MHVMALSATSTGDKLKNVASPLAALIYPWLVALGPGVAPPLLLLSLAVPVVAFWLAYRTIDPQRFPIARRIAFLATGAPALFSLTGGWLDGLDMLPMRGTGFWLLLWTGLSLLAVAEPDRGATAPLDEPERPGRVAMLRTLHGVSAAFILLFAAFHLGNHLLGLLGGHLHWAVMQSLRLAYRHPYAEAALIASVAFQMVSGALLFWRSSGIRRDLPATLQAASGLYLLCFFASHVSAVFRTRYLHGTDTDWRWLTSSPLFTDEWSARLVPYYWLGIVALGIHGAAGLQHVLLAHGVAKRRARTAFLGFSIAGLVIASLIMTGLVLGSHGSPP